MNTHTRAAIENYTQTHTLTHTHSRVATTRTRRRQDFVSDNWSRGRRVDLGSDSRRTVSVGMLEARICIVTHVIHIYGIRWYAGSKNMYHNTC